MELAVSEIYYNVWSIYFNRWTNSSKAIEPGSLKPKKLSLKEAQEICNDLLIYGLTWEVRQLTEYATHLEEVKKSDKIVSIVAINDHVCKTCGNEKCSKQEKSCWKCGNLL